MIRRSLNLSRKGNLMTSNTTEILEKNTKNPSKLEDDLENLNILINRAIQIFNRFIIYIQKTNKEILHEILSDNSNILSKHEK